MIFKNPEVKNLFLKFMIVIIISILLVLGVSNLTINTIQNKVIENNQILVGTLVKEYPQIEKDIIGIITQGKNAENLKYGEEILNKYGYYKGINKNNEPIINESINQVYKYSLGLASIIIFMMLSIIVEYLVKLYKDISDMTNYVYNSSENKEYNMKNKNQEGQIGLLKTELMKMTNILREKVDLLKNEKIFLNDAISDISHQLKTPLTSLVLINEILYDDVPKEVKIDFLDKTKLMLNRMEWLVKSMLKLSKIDAKVIDFKKDKVNIKELIYKSIEPSKMLMESKNIDLSVKGEEEFYFIGDMEWSVEALVNIIKNCVEHTKEHGKLEITYNNNPIYSEIIVKDNGQGIHKEDLKHIFKRFYKGKNSTKEDSVGIGLAMAKSIINSQGGDIKVKSVINKGTEFHITIHKSYCD